MKLTRCAEHMSFTYARGLRPALYKGLHATAARLVQKVVAGTGSGNRALWEKLTKMFYVPGVAHRNAIFGLKADSARPSDSFHPVRASPRSASTCWNSWRTEHAEEQGRLPQSFGHEPCGYGIGARLAGSVLLSQPPEDDLPQGALRHLSAIALAQARRKRALEVTHI